MRAGEGEGLRSRLGDFRKGGGLGLSVVRWRSKVCCWIDWEGEVGGREGGEVGGREGILC